MQRAGASAGNAALRRAAASSRTHAPLHLYMRGSARSPIIPHARAPPGPTIHTLLWSTIVPSRSFRPPENLSPIWDQVLRRPARRGNRNRNRYITQRGGPLRGSSAPRHVRALQQARGGGSGAPRKRAPSATHALVGPLSRRRAPPITCRHSQWCTLRRRLRRRPMGLAPKTQRCPRRPAAPTGPAPGQPAGR